MTNENFNKFISNNYPVTLFDEMNKKENIAYECNDGLVSCRRFDKEGHIEYTEPDFSYLRG